MCPEGRSVDPRKKFLLRITAGCVVVLVGAMVLAVVLNQREAGDFAATGVRVTARLLDKTTREETIRRRTTSTHYCFRVEFRIPDGGTATGSSCDRGIDQLYTRVKPGDELRIVYRPDDLVRHDDGTGTVADFVLADWADGRLTSFSGPS
jgi:hypothetical protein